MLLAMFRAALPPRTHNLNSLGRDLNVPASVAVDLRAMNPTFDLVRYPDPGSGVAPVDAVTIADATRHLDAALRVMAWLDTQLNPAQPPNQP